ncbi:Imidazole glycerol phosphate synthase subunit HisF [Dyadobacter sp. CECT 9275]|uniref:imidazole glycerol-phosphate synthase n=1 Tax=Dyadobacter helix TaxID=2822344 RepID=A0A916NC47_9BACT|nr:AglZ/HisF2 family acetamidino modification protein [Dyadobacter sp. CECT 9275]CAG4999638.1 Imidazole glycerol phosphate synthase subunit HisF [Dyadobacter sp. CECT 9275]
MFRPRVIPVLLLKDKGLVKSVKFSNYRYIGDPINAVRIFNELKADELVFLDILATKEKRSINLDFVRQVGDEANMPFAVGGGIQTIRQIKDTINAGAEKVIINSFAVRKPAFIKEASEEFGSSTIVVSIDIKKRLLGKKQVYTESGSYATGLNPVEWAQQMEANGAGEIIITSIDHDGMMQGYDLVLIQAISAAVSIPVVASGGAGELADFKAAVQLAHASAVAAGSLFVYHGPRKAVLVNYPKNEELRNLFSPS